jgi:hypothetical protein
MGLGIARQKKYREIRGLRPRHPLEYLQGQHRDRLMRNRVSEAVMLLQPYRQPFLTPPMPIYVRIFPLISRVIGFQLIHIGLDVIRRSEPGHCDVFGYSRSVFGHDYISMSYDDSESAGQTSSHTRSESGETSSWVPNLFRRVCRKWLRSAV